MKSEARKMNNGINEYELVAKWSIGNKNISFTPHHSISSQCGMLNT